MTCSRLAMMGVLIVVVVGLVGGVLGATSERHATAATGPPELGFVIAELDLSDFQGRRISELLDDAMLDVRQLRELSRINARRLRAVELDHPFDPRFVNQLVERQAVLMAHARGRESRLFAEIGELLSPEQRRRLRELLAEGTAPLLHRPPAAKPTDRREARLDAAGSLPYLSGRIYPARGRREG